MQPHSNLRGNSGRSTLTIVHVSDPHWICRKWRHSGRALQEIEHFATFERLFAEIRDAEFDGLLGETNIMIHSGDSANCYPYHKVPLAKQYDDIKKYLIPLLIGNNDHRFDKKIVIPGNHDLERSREMGRVVSINGNEVKCRPMGGKKFSWSPNSFTNEPSVFNRISEGKQIISHMVMGNNSDSVILDVKSGADVELQKGDIFEINFLKRFESFEDAFTGWEKGAETRDVEVKVGKFIVRIGLFNSAMSCSLARDKKGEIVDYVQVGDGAIAKWEKLVQEGDKIRIGVLHHNPFPNANIWEEKKKRDVFIDNGSFIDSMVKTNVKILLSGHNHAGDELYFERRPDRRGQLGESDGFARPHIESGILSVNAPTFLRESWDTILPGFNVMKLELDESSNIIDVIIYHFRFQRPSRIVKTQSIYRIALKNLHSIHSQEECTRRSEFMRKSVDLAYSYGSLNPAERIFHLGAGDGTIANIVRTERECLRHGTKNVSGIYSISVLSPDTWWAKELTRHFRNSFQEHDRRFSEHNKLRRMECSKSVMTAINTSTQGALELGIAGDVAAFLLTASDNLRNEKTKLNENNEFEKLRHEEIEWIEKMIDRKTTVSLSNCAAQWEKFDADDEGQGTVRSTVWEAGDWDIPNLMDEVNSSHFEVARIVLWPLEFFESEYAQRVIEFHEDFSVPLFWLDPARLRNRNGELRDLSGQYMICAHKSGKNTKEIKPIYVKSDPKGDSKSKSILGYQEDHYRGLSPAQQLWDVDGFPLALTHFIDFPTSEMKILLRRPDILFASDIYFIVKAGGDSGAAKLSKRLDDLKSKIDEWLILPFD